MQERVKCVDHLQGGVLKPEGDGVLGIEAAERLSYVFATGRMASSK